VAVEEQERIKTRLVAGTINKYPAEEGWNNLHLDKSDRPLYDIALGKPGQPAEIITDLANLKKHTQFHGFFDEIKCHQVFEHIAKNDTVAVMEGFIACLRPGGTLDMETPDFGKICEAWVEHEYLKEDMLQMVFGQQTTIPDDHLQAHRYGWDYDMMYQLMYKVGFRIISQDIGGGLCLRILAKKDS